MSHVAERQIGPGGTGESVPVLGTSPPVVVKVFEENPPPQPQEQQGGGAGGTGDLPSGTVSRQMEGLHLDAAVGESGEKRYRFLDHQPCAMLNSGYSMPLIGLGTWKSEKGEVKVAVEAAIRAGYRHIDCAQAYQNEHEVGEALQAVFKEGVVKREELFITSKLWNSCHGAPDVVERGLRRTLRDLQLDYLDLYLVHWPVTGNKGPTLQPPYAQTWSSMESLVDKGLVRSIGVSNMSVRKLQQLLGSCRIRPAVNQVEVHPFHRNDSLLQFCKDQGIHVTAYSPLGSPDSANVIKRRHTPSLLHHPQVLALAEKYEKNAGQILVRWALQHGTSVLPKSTHPDRIASNIDVLGWDLSSTDYDSLSKLEPQVRMVDGSFWLTPEGPYRTLADLWDDPEEDRRQSDLVRATYTNLGGVINGVRMPTAKLISGFEIPLVGLGTWKSNRGEVKESVDAALRMGYRHVDCAQVYDNEHEIGEALSAILEEGVITREELFITSKLWNTDHGDVEAACRRSLQSLKLSYLDLYLIHWPASTKTGVEVQPSYAQTWSGMESLVDKGLVRSIGVSNMSVRKLQQLLGSCRIRPAVNQIEVHPYFRNDSLLQFCKDQGIHVTAYSPLGSPDSATIMGRRDQGVALLQHPKVEEVAKKLHKSNGQVLLRWGLQHGTSVLPKSVHPDRLRTNIDILNWELSKEGFEALSKLEPQTRMVAGSFLLHPQGPFKRLSELWDEETEGVTV